MFTKQLNDCGQRQWNGARLSLCPKCTKQLSEVIYTPAVLTNAITNQVVFCVCV